MTRSKWDSVIPGGWEVIEENLTYRSEDHQHELTAKILCEKLVTLDVSGERKSFKGKRRIITDRGVPLSVLEMVNHVPQCLEVMVARQRVFFRLIKNS